MQTTPPDDPIAATHVYGLPSSRPNHVLDVAFQSVFTAGCLLFMALLVLGGYVWVKLQQQRGGLVLVPEVASAPESVGPLRVRPPFPPAAI